MKIIKQFIFAIFVAGVFVPSALVAWGAGIQTIGQKEANIKARLSVLEELGVIGSSQKQSYTERVAGVMQQINGLLSAEALLALHGQINVIDRDLQALESTEVKYPAPAPQASVPAHPLVVAPVDRVAIPVVASAGNTGPASTAEVKAADVKALESKVATLSADLEKVKKGANVPKTDKNDSSDDKSKKKGICKLTTYFIAAGGFALPLAVIYGSGPASLLWYDAIKKCSLFLPKIMPFLSAYLPYNSGICNAVSPIIGPIAAKAAGYGALASGAVFVAWRNAKQLVKKCRNEVRTMVS